MNDSHTRCPAGIVGEAGNTKRVLLLNWRTFQGVREANRVDSRLAERPNDPWTRFIADRCYRWAASLDFGESKFIKAQTFDARLITFQEYFVEDYFRPQFITFRDNSISKRFGDVFWSLFLNLALEILVEAFNQKQNYSPSSGVSVVRHSYQVAMPLFALEIEHDREQEDRRNKQTYEEYHSQRQNYPAQRRKDWEVEDLAPADKVRVLKYAIDWFNDVGFLTWEYFFEYDFIERDFWSTKLATEFFTANRKCTVADLMMIIEQCAEAKFEKVRPGDREYDEKWHVRKGCDLNFLLRHIDKINDQLGRPFEADYFQPLLTSKGR